MGIVVDDLAAATAFFVFAALHLADELRAAGSHAGRPWPSGVSIIASSARTPSSLTTRSTQPPAEQIG